MTSSAFIIWLFLEVATCQLQHFEAISVGIKKGAQPGLNDEPKVKESCNPHPNIEAAQYIVGYGSLMQTASKNRTYPWTGENIPVEVSGFSREWNLQGESVGPGTTYLGAAPTINSSFNAAIFEILPAQNSLELLGSFDKRERNYCRQKVNRKYIKILSMNEGVVSATPPEGEYWIYVNKEGFKKQPNKEYPIVQSYVDVFISGCLELQEKYNLMDFANRCVDTTKGWRGEFWVNDRIFPRRPFIHEKRAPHIDKVLHSRLQQEFKKIRIEG